MALELDGFETWRAIADHRRIFASLRAEASKSARAALTKHLKSKAVGLAELREARKALGKDIFILVVNGMKDSEVKTLVGRLDKHHPEFKTASPEWRRRQLLDLAKGDADPVAKPAPAKRSKTARKRPAKPPAGTDDLSYVSAGAVRKR